MGKLCLLFLLFAALISSPLLVVYAEDSIVETRNVNLIIDGKQIKFNDVPIAVNERVLLPLRDLLVSLGVPNDDQHIVWNNDEKSVTIIKDSKRIYLRLGSNTAFINDMPVTLDVAPVGYRKNGRTYIPARFIAQVLGKKVVWNDKISAIEIIDEAEYTNVKEILNQVTGAMKNVDRLRINHSRYFKNLDGTDIVAAYTKEAICLIDYKNKIMSEDEQYNMFPENKTITTSRVYADSRQYIRSSSMQSWGELPIDIRDYNRLLAEANVLNYIYPSEEFCAALTINKDTNNIQFVLEGDIRPTKEELTGIKGHMGLDDAHMRIVINKSDMTILEVSVSTRTKWLPPSETKISVMTEVLKFSDINKEFKIEIPKTSN